MPFGLENQLSKFFWAVDALLLAVNWRFEIVYLDDVIIISRYVEDPPDHLLAVLGLLSRAFVSLTLKICFLCEDQTDFWGHVLQHGKFGIWTNETDAIWGFQKPLSQSEPKLFLYLPSLPWRFAPIFVRNVASLNCKVGMDQAFPCGLLKKIDIE